jgi:hypothetical protein
MVLGRADVPAIHTMGRPAGALFSLLVVNDSGTWWLHGVTVESIVGIQLGISVQPEIDP